MNIKIEETIKHLPDRKKVRGKLFKKVAVVAVITLVTATCLIVIFPAYARNVPVISDVFQYLSDNNIIDKDYIKYSSDLNISRTSNDVTVTINSIVYDGLYLSIGYTVESQKELKGEQNILDKNFKINGKETSFSSGGAGKLIDKHTYVGVDIFDVSRDYLPKEVKKRFVGGEVKIPDNFIMDLNIREFSGGIRGKWNFKFKVSIDKIKNKAKGVNIAIDLSEIKPNTIINEVIFSPINTVLRTTEELTISDEPVGYFVVDDKGRTLKCEGSHGSGSGKNNKFYYQYKFTHIYEDTKAVTFIPYIPVRLSKESIEKIKSSGGKHEEESKEVVLNLNGTTILSQGRLGEYKVTKIEILKD